MTCQQFAYLSSSLPPRRRFLKMTVLCGLGLLVPDSVHGLVRKDHSPEKSLSLTHLHRRESLNVVYHTRSGYAEKALAEISYLMRDRRTGEVKKIDPRLLDYLYAIKKILKPTTPFCIISGYRTRETNQILQRAGKGAAANSYHLKGKAADICLRGIRPASLYWSALKAHAGGVGFYPDRHFVHLDVGPIRSWIA